MMPLVSVVMSVYDNDPYLEEAIESVLAQTMRDFEFIIIDDGSTDASLEIIKAHAAVDARIVVIARENRGLVDSLNEGIDKAKGQYIARMDADDIALPERLEIQSAYLQEHPEIGVVGSWVEVLDGSELGRIGRYSVDDAMLRCELLFSSPFAHPTVMMRKQVLDESGFSYDSAFVHAEDYALWYHLSKVTRLANIPQVLLRYRVLNESVTRKADRDDLSRERTMRGIYDEILDELGLSLTKAERSLHYVLTLNTRIARHYYEPELLLTYFERIVAANAKRGLFDTTRLLQLLGKKWLWHTRYHLRSHPGLLLYALSSRYTYHGLFAVYQNKKAGV